MHASFARALTLIVIFSIASSSQAAIIGPYSVDANTLHLWHLNDSAVPIQDASGVATPINLASLGGGTGQSLGATSFAGFGTAYSGVATAETGIFAKTPVSGAGDDTSTASFRGPGGGYTYEMILRADFDPTVTPTSYQLFSFENDSTTNRDFQFILAHGPDAGTDHLLKFIQISGSVVTVDSSLFSIVQGHWYHVAVAYNGNQGAAGNLIL